jgi:hypothetical protein
MEVGAAFRGSHPLWAAIAVIWSTPGTTEGTMVQPAGASIDPRTHTPGPRGPGTVRTDDDIVVVWWETLLSVPYPPLQQVPPCSGGASPRRGRLW